MAATSSLIPVEEYLRTAYRPDCDYVDGEVRERNMGETPHSKLQAFFTWYFRSRREEWQIDALPEQRVQISATRYRIPDLCVISHDAPDELILRTAPMLCVEILSREDRMTDILDRVEDYLHMGVPSVWVVDPWRKKAYVATSTGTLHPEAAVLRIQHTPIQVPVAEIFRELEVNRN